MEQYSQDRVFLTDDMLYPPPSVLHMYEDEGDKTLGVAHKAYSSPNESTPLHVIHRATLTPNSSSPHPALKDIYVEQNVRLQAWALRNQTCVSQSLTEQLDATSGSPLKLDTSPGGVQSSVSISITARESAIAHAYQPLMPLINCTVKWCNAASRNCLLIAESYEELQASQAEAKIRGQSLMRSRACHYASVPPTPAAAPSSTRLMIPLCGPAAEKHAAYAKQVVQPYILL